ncbi:MAG: two-component sensor histidine kinase [Gammaproteobacteria bacterium]|uniref:histidine kinase dimerization/phospho-acceptor domain-containing protein n=1 Tax=Rhodoferax sp. TaxID=50421 RepID=UPI0018287958|nr:histidine kinase dimerization/phospho-acceptor domain-containing protein [Rhodoferax sp.]MBU3900682.1 two-component sensor histidine kinase [Gammaproteobacteria bacterium]MBA3058135.1 two-component sensor histidine kinase [Rhodoferax sp.]MBU3998392.1 two-component sensor histidine kinase [Gammaproteobacteria bacterium]MBU4081340.1 two-component sensor histidine kinase [Gammaproteobacteria bacterium]MBU4114528.1 two-component sensor histidine kinase [Gammaproteobacteria bacterium]
MAPKSLTASLMAWTLGALFIVWGGFVLLGYKTGIHEADELTDGHLASVALLQLAGNTSPSKTLPEIDNLAGHSNLKSHDYQRSMSVLVWDAAGNILMRTGEAPQVRFSATEGFETLQLGTPAVAWRAFSRWDGPAHTRRVMVLLNAAERDELAQDIAEQVAGPGLWLLPVVALVLGFAIRRGLRPLYALSRDVDALNIHQPSPLHGPYAQRELRAVVDSINTLAGRYQGAVSRERELATELAHELRTPLASLTLQARALRHAASPEEHEQLLLQLERDALRAGQVLGNLLALARASRTEMMEAQQIVDLDEIARAEVAEFGQAALDSEHELALLSPGPFVLTGHAVLLGLVLRNLVENALSHTPPGTQVEVQLDPQERWLQVCDTATQSTCAGPAKALAAGPSRALGLGSGHRVVEKIAAIHGARFERLSTAPGFGSCYRLTFAPANHPAVNGEGWHQPASA